LDDSNRWVRLANLTSHDQAENVAVFRKFGFDVDPCPLLPHIDQDENPILTAAAAVREARLLQPDGVLVAGRTDLAVYAALMAVEAGLRVFTPRVAQRARGPLHFGSQLLGLTELRLQPGMGVKIA
jgi:hypothetical protein